MSFIFKGLKIFLYLSGGISVLLYISAAIDSYQVFFTPEKAMPHDYRSIPMLIVGILAFIFAFTYTLIVRLFKSKKLLNC